MTVTLVKKALRGSLAHVRHVTAVRPGAARGAVAAVYAQVERDFGMLAPPVALHSPSPEVLAAAWTVLRETLVAAGAVSRAGKEAVATAVSRANSCPYCVAVHDATLQVLGAGDEDPMLRWAAEASTEAGARAYGTPFTAAQVPELVGTAVAFHYYNRVVHVFLDSSPIPTQVPPSIRARLMRMTSRLTRTRLDVATRPGEALDLLPPAPLPADLRWAAANPTIAEGFARAAAAMDAAGARAVPPAVHTLVTSSLATWDGTLRGPSRAWVEEAVAPLPGPERAAGRLALLTAFAPFQVTPDVVAACRESGADDRTLVELVAWSALTTARRVGTWITTPATTSG
ncbi:MAG TPA: carboxymuconolactone decarboxylase family protein [Pseudonocardiaceae bacterium]